MRRNFLRGTAISLWASVFGALFAFLVVTWVVYDIRQNRLHAQAEQTRQAALLARVLEEQLSRNLSQTELLLRALSGQLPPAQPQAPLSVQQQERIHGQMQDILLAVPHVRSLAWVDQQGLVQLSTAPRSQGKQLTPVQMAALWPSQASGQAGSSDNKTVRVDTAWAGRDLFDGVPLQTNTPTAALPSFLPMVLVHPAGAVVALINVDSIVNFHRNTLNEPSAFTEVWAYDQRLLFDARDSRDPLHGKLAGQQRAEAIFTEFLPKREQGALRLPDTGNAVAFRVVKNYPLLVRVELSWAHTLSSLRATEFSVISIGVVLLVVVGGLALLLVQAQRRQERQRDLMHRTHQRLADREEWLHAILETAPDAILVVEENGLISHANQAAERMFLPLEQVEDGASIKNKKIVELLPAWGNLQHELAVATDGTSVLRAFSHSAFNLQSEAKNDMQACRLNSHGETESFPVEMNVSEFAQSGRANAQRSYVAVLRDVTQQRADDAKLKSMSARLTRAINGAHDGLWETNLDTGEVYYSPRYLALLGMELRGLPADRQDFLREIVCPEDVEDYDRNIQEQFVDRGHGRFDVRYLHANGEYRWFRVRGQTTLDPVTGERLMSGVITDIHAQKMAEYELAAHRDRLADLVSEKTQELRSAALKADEANRAKSEFLANMSHELRTPMHAILSFAKLGTEKLGKVEASKIEHYLSNIHASGTRLLRLLNDLLDLSKLEAGKMDMQKTETDLCTLLHEVLRELAELINNRNLSLQFLPEPLPERANLQADPTRIMQVLRNLLSNAIKFTPAGGQIYIQIKPVFDHPAANVNQPDGWDITVQDTGIGIPENELESVFDKFVQSSHTKTGAGGTGLGLPICREIVQAHGGSIHAENRPAVASGVCFVVHLPII